MKCFGHRSLVTRDIPVLRRRAVGPQSVALTIHPLLKLVPACSTANPLPRLQKFLYRCRRVGNIIAQTQQQGCCLAQFLMMFVVHLDALTALVPSAEIGVPQLSTAAAQNNGILANLACKFRTVTCQPATIGQHSAR